MCIGAESLFEKEHKFFCEFQINLVCKHEELDVERKARNVEDLRSRADSRRAFQAY